MKRFLLLTGLMSVFSVSMMYGQIKFGVTAGVGISDLSLKKSELIGNFEKSNLTGFIGGVTMEANIPLINLGVSTGLLYTQRGVKVGDESIRNSYLDIPVFLKKKFIPLSPVQPFIQAGPYFSIAVDKKDLGVLKDEFGDFNNFDWGLGLGAGVSLFSKVDVGAYYGWGLSKSYKLLDSSKNRGWNITATYFF